MQTRRICQKRLKIEVKLPLSANKKSYMTRRLSQQRMTFSDLERPFHIIRIARYLCGSWTSSKYRQTPCDTDGGDYIISMVELISKTFKTREGSNYSDVLPLKADQRDSISNLTFWGFESELQTNPMSFHLESLCRATLMPLRGCAMDWDAEKRRKRAE